MSVGGSKPKKVVDLSAAAQGREARADMDFFEKILMPATKMGVDRAQSLDLSGVAEGKASADGFQELSKSTGTNVKLGLQSGSFGNVFGQQTAKTERQATSLSARVGLAGQQAEIARQDHFKKNFAKLGVELAQDQQSELNKQAASATSAEISNIQREQKADEARLEAIGTVVGGVAEAGQKRMSDMKTAENGATARASDDYFNATGTEYTSAQREAVSTAIRKKSKFFTTKRNFGLGG